MLTDKDHIFDGFAHRPYNEDIDGHMNTRLNTEKLISVRLADEIFDMVQEINKLRKRVWELESQAKQFK